MAPIALDPMPRSAFVTKMPASSLSRKRANHELDSDDVAHDIPSKRLKVAFDPEVEVRMVEDLGEKSLALIRAEVGHAIRQHEAGEHEEYDNLKQIFHTSPYDEEAPSSNLLRKYLLGLNSNTVLLKRSASDLVNAVIRFQWLGLDDAFVTLYTRFLGNLVSSHTGYLSPVLKMLVENFAHSKSKSFYPG
jgi:RNA polymerase I-specific transcription initiation factor RRN3